MARIYYGAIVWAPFVNGRRGTKGRPAVIIDSDENCDGDGPVLAVAITSSFTLPLPYYHIMVHDSNVLHRVTGLYERCVAKCSWPRKLEQREIIENLGEMPDNLLDAICDAYGRIQADLNFDDWQ